MAMVARRVHALHMEGYATHATHEAEATRVDKHADSLSASDRFAVESLAQEMSAEPALVSELYERELTQLESSAKVRGFLSVLTSRKVRMLLHAHRSAHISDHSSHAHA
jgi:hypothetical protein